MSVSGKASYRRPGSRTMFADSGGAVSSDVERAPPCRRRFSSNSRCAELRRSRCWFAMMVNLGWKGSVLVGFELSDDLFLDRHGKACACRVLEHSLHG